MLRGHSIADLGYDGRWHPDIYLRMYYLPRFLRDLGRRRRQVCYLRSERIGVPLQDYSDCFLPDRLVLDIIAAAIAIAISAILSARETFTVKLQTSRVFTVATLASRSGRVSRGSWGVESGREVYALLRVGLVG